MPEKTGLMDLAFVAAHQLKSPLSGVQTTLSLLLGGFAGSFTEQQRELLERANKRAAQGTDLVADLFRLRSLDTIKAEDLLPVSAHSSFVQALERVRTQAKQGRVRLISDSDLRGSDWIMAEPRVLLEILHVLVDNAVKYTPEGGEVRTSITCDSKSCVIEVVDSGIGIPPESWEKLFTDFFRAPNAKSQAKEGTGLGLSFAKRAAQVLGGELHLKPSASGGVHATVTFASTKAPEQQRDIEHEVSRRVVVIGGVTAGPKAAARIMRLDPLADVTIVERGRLLSYAGCGLPYYISGAVAEQRDLVSSPLGDVRDLSFFHNLKNVKIMDMTEALEILRDDKQVKVKRQGEVHLLGYDQLLLATGAKSRIPEGINKDLRGIYTLHGVEDAEAIRSELAASKARDVVIVGAGVLGCEITEAVAQAGTRITLVESRASILGIIDGDLAWHAKHHLESKGVRTLAGRRCIATRGKNRVEAAVLDDGTEISCEFLILAAGVIPAAELADNAGLELGPHGAVKVNRQMQSSDPSIFAAGDCAESFDLITGDPVWAPMGSTAIRQGRAAASAICELESSFSGICRSSIVKLFELTIAGVGLNKEQALAAGFDPVVATVPGPDRAHYLPAAKEIIIRMIADRKSHKLLGAQGIGYGDVSKRIEVATTAITAGMTLEQLSDLDLPFAPSFGLALDTINTAANVLLNRITGHCTAISFDELRAELKSDSAPLILDVRLPSELRSRKLLDSLHIPLGSLRGRLHQVPKDRRIVTVCETGLRAYEASLILRSRGYCVRTLDGGLRVWNPA